MAHQWIKANLQSQGFPLLSNLWGDTVVAQTAGELQGNDNLPQVYYMENVMPTSAGYQSIDWTLITPPPLVGMIPGRHFREVFELKCPNPLGPAPGIPEFISVYIATTLGANNGMWVYDTSNSGVWVFTNTPVAAFLPMQITTAFVQGQTYIFLANKQCFIYDPTIASFINTPLVGVTMANITGITTANGYMIAYGTDAVLWSSLVNPLDFTPSLVTGAGGGNIGEIKAQIYFCANISGGFIIYTADNAVQANYTGNVQAPFKFQDIPGSGGVTVAARVTYADSSSSHFFYGNKGLQLIQIGSDAQGIFPEVTELLSAGYTEKYDSGTNTFVYTLIPNSDTPLPLVTLIGTRYMVISYDAETIVAPDGGSYQNYSRAVVFDVLLKRWGKIVKDHVDVIDYENLDSGGLAGQPVDLSPRAKLAMVDYLGNFQRINSDLTIPSHQTGAGNSILVLGKWQLQRNRGVYLQRVQFENLITGQTWSCFALPSYDGRTLAPAVTLTELTDNQEFGPSVKTFAGRVYGKNISIVLQGNFNLTSVEVDLVLGADF